MALHADQGYATEPWPASPLAVNVGGSSTTSPPRSAPPSTCPAATCSGAGRAPARRSSRCRSTPRPGSLLVMDGRLWHRSGVNTTTDRHRAAMFGYYVRPWIRPQINWNVALDPERRRRARRRIPRPARLPPRPRRPRGQPPPHRRLIRRSPTGGNARRLNHPKGSSDDLDLACRADPRLERHAIRPTAAALRDLPAADAPGRARTRRCSMQRDLELIEHLDALGYDEAWIGEHHSSGFETIASPEVFIAAAAERTQRIKLGTGVNSLPYHHPLILADRIVMLDHLTRGPDDVRRRARPADVRRVDARHRPRRAAADDGGELRRHHGPVPRRDRRRRRPTGSRSTRAACSCARTRDCSTSPSPRRSRRRARRSPAATASGCCRSPRRTRPGSTMLAGHWAVMEEQAAEHGTTVDRSQVADDGSDAHRRDRAGGGRQLPLRARAGDGLPRPRRADGARRRRRTTRAASRR